ncbi:MAG: MFS transporter [Rhodomicrobium sp.]
MLQALRGKDFRLFLAGQTLSLFGNQVQQVGLLWLIYQISDSAIILGTTVFLLAVPVALIAPLIGVWADCASPLRLLIVTQTLFSVQALALGALLFAGQPGTPAILVLVCVQGVLNGIDMPLRQILVPRLLRTRHELGSGVALSALVYDLTRVLGPALGGLVAATSGERATFLLNGLAHFAAIGAFIAIRPRRWPVAAKGTGAVCLLRQGWQYVAALPPLRAIFLLSAGMGFAGSAYMVLLPVIARDTLGAGAQGLGLLMSAAGAGAVAGGIFFGSAKNADHHPRLIAAGAWIFAIGLTGLSLLLSIMAAAIALGVAGFGIMIMMAASNTTLIGLAGTDKQGRILGLFTLSYGAAAPLGGLCAGFAADHFGAQATLAGSAVLGLAAAAWFSPYAPRLIVLMKTRTLNY